MSKKKKSIFSFNIKEKENNLNMKLGIKGFNFKVDIPKEVVGIEEENNNDKNDIKVKE